MALICFVGLLKVKRLLNVTLIKLVLEVRKYKIMTFKKN